MDKREIILLRLFAVLSAVDGVTTYVRNRGHLPDDKRPAIYLLDGDEAADDRAFDRGRLSESPNLVSLDPEVYIALDGRGPDNARVGEDLNAFRVKIVKAVLFDATLKALIGTNGQIKYRGCVTDLARGRAMNGEMGIHFTLIYHFKPSEL